MQYFLIRFIYEYDEHIRKTIEICYVSYKVLLKLKVCSIVFVEHSVFEQFFLSNNLSRGNFHISFSLLNWNCWEWANAFLSSIFRPTSTSKTFFCKKQFWESNHLHLIKSWSFKSEKKRKLKPRMEWNALRCTGWTLKLKLFLLYLNQY